MTGNTPSDPPSDPSSASTEPSPAPSEPVEGASAAGTARRLSGQIGLGAVMVLCGVLLATTARISGGESIRSESGDVADVLRDRDGAITQLSQGAADKRSEIEELSGQRADTDTEERTRTVSDAVGLSAVSGTAVRVTLTDAPSGALGTMSGVEADDLVVHQQDMEAYINALWAGGAEAMMLQDQRVVNGSSFRCAGNTLLLEGRVYSPPFVITAIGDPEELTAALDAAPGVQVYREWVDHVGLGERTEVLDDVTVPAFDGSLTIDIAKAG
ncbi:MAG TPA: DUF881 domain-containing protein [Candidatus Brachybacterium merdavium]|uniref:DUF881 domain-containing protein n=1 Tax=Candidatus Brachybacterium merdavium TaxID=2838513 RepID=A0A9D2LBJ6_9MICO|nr:DUF881 domain-containing protein [Candidatus Brachybacterium merdavium]